MKAIRVERISNAQVTLVTDSHINYIAKGSGTRFAFYSDCGDDSPMDLFDKAIRKDLRVDMMIERLQKGAHQRDYIISVKFSE